MGIIASYLQSRLMIEVSQKAVMNVRKNIFEKVQGLPIGYYDTNSNAEIMSYFTNDVDAIGEMLNTTLVQLISGMISVIGTLKVMKLLAQLIQELKSILKWEWIT